MKKLLWILLLAVCCTAAAEGLTPLPLDDDGVYGAAPQAAGYLSDWVYEDASIRVEIEAFDYEGLACLEAKIRIADSSQIRTTKSSRSFDDSEMVKSTLMAKKARAVFAVNGDFFKNNVFGYTYRQCTLVKKRLVNLAAGKYDLLFIDDQGDFHTVERATEESGQALVDALAAEGRRPVNSFTFGPTLILRGEKQEFNPELWQGHAPMQRVAIAQTGPLSYSVFQCDGSTGDCTGLTMSQLADMMLSRCDTILVGYNLDGGGSANLVFRNEKINDNRDVRQICDMIYFASIDYAEEKK